MIRRGAEARHGSSFCQASRKNSVAPSSRRSRVVWSRSSSCRHPYGDGRIAQTQPARAPGRAIAAGYARLARGVRRCQARGLRRCQARGAAPWRAEAAPRHRTRASLGGRRWEGVAGRASLGRAPLGQGVAGPGRRWAKASSGDSGCVGRWHHRVRPGTAKRSHHRAFHVTAAALGVSQRRTSSSACRASRSPHREQPPMVAREPRVLR
jgi:hypothetical protein